MTCPASFDGSISFLLLVAFLRRVPRHIRRAHNSKYTVMKDLPNGEAIPILRAFIDINVVRRNSRNIHRGIRKRKTGIIKGKHHKDKDVR